MLRVSFIAGVRTQHCGVQSTTTAGFVVIAAAADSNRSSSSSSNIIHNSGVVKIRFNFISYTYTNNALGTGVQRVL